MVFFKEVRKVLLVLNLLLCFLIFISKANPLYYMCPNTSTYNPNSTYHRNRNILLSNLSSNNMRNNLFYNETIGNYAADSVYGLYMCRGDVTNDTCHTCVVTATQEIIKRCPQEKEVYIWYDDCFLRYDNKSFFSTKDTSFAVYITNTGNVTYTDHFMKVLISTMNNLATQASEDQWTNDGVTVRGFATREANITSYETLYNLVQCTPDLSRADCDQCIRNAISKLRSCCNGRPGGRVLFRSCNIRYETYPFYRNTDSTTLPPKFILPLPPPTPIFLDGNVMISTRVIIAIVVSGMISTLLFILGFCCLRTRIKKYGYIEVAGDGREMTDIDETEISAAESLQYDLSSILVATNNFSPENKVGQGGFGEVFKGILPDGQEIAVKRLSKTSTQGALEFKNEVFVVAKLQHKNLVRLVGYCLARGEKILIYEFVPNKSLDRFLFEKQQLLDWSTRYNIINGIALGILYLHEDSGLKIIHRDIKASNVLLDGDMKPKISDFGMARIFGIDQSQGDTSKIAGTFGYMSPEYALHGQFSVKSDVFSFGVLILEIVSGMKNNREDILGNAWKHWRDKRPLDIVDPSLGDLVARNEVIRCIHIGLLCVQEDPNGRPTIASVVLMLSSNTVTLPLPGQPPFVFPSRIHTTAKHLVLNESSR